MRTLVDSPLTERQHEAFEFIVGYVRERGKPPTLAEIGRALSIKSVNGVYKLVATLERKGYIERTPRVARGITVVDRAGGDLRTPPALLPVVRSARSDLPRLLRQDLAGALHVDVGLLGGAEADACLVAIAGDDGMSERGIRMGDLLIVEEVDWQHLFSGELVAAVLKNGILARRFEFSRKKMRLLPEARSYSAESFPPGSPECFVIGRVLSVMRSFSRRSSN